VSLLAAEIERQGIATVCQQYFREVAEKLRPPRALLVPYDLGYALGEPNDPALQMSVLRDTFALLDEAGPPPVLKEFVPMREATQAQR
jgi:hypothetical protein